MLQPGQTLQARYQLTRLLGKTTGRQTWLAQDLALHPVESVVVKLLSLGDSMEWDDLKLFEREALVLQQLSHPQIPKYRDSFTVEDRLFWFGLVQDYLPGDSLKQLLQQGRHFSEAQVRQMATSLLKLLIYLHELSPAVLHRDIKPGNLILGKDDRAPLPTALRDHLYLVDFGSVQNRAATEGATFTIVGTYGYAPMEQFSGRAVPASDLYGLGATLIHLVTGRSPADLPQKNLRIQFADRVSLAPAFEQWMSKLVEPDVDDRFQTARAALAALQGQTSQGQALQPVRSVHLPRQDILKTGTFNAPAGSITVEQSPQDLLITLPGVMLWKLLWYLPFGIAIALIGYQLLPMLAWVIGFSSAVLIGLLVTVAIAGFAYWEFLPTFVEFDRREFCIYKRPFGWLISINAGPTHAISDVFHTLKTFGSKYETRVVVLQLHHVEILLGRGIGEENCRWLVSVLQSWLKLD